MVNVGYGNPELLGERWRRGQESAMGRLLHLLKAKPAALLVALVWALPSIGFAKAGVEGPCVLRSLAELDESEAKRYVPLMTQLSHIKVCCGDWSVRTVTGIGRARSGKGVVSFDLKHLEGRKTGAPYAAIGVAESSEGQPLEESLYGYVVVESMVEGEFDLHGEATRVMRLRRCLGSCECLHSLLDSAGPTKSRTDPDIKRLRRATNEVASGFCAQVDRISFRSTKRVRVLFRVGEETWVLGFGSNDAGERKLHFVASASARPICYPDI